jgi:hypothetical protein
MKDILAAVHNLAHCRTYTATVEKIEGEKCVSYGLLLADSSTPTAKAVCTMVKQLLSCSLTHPCTYQLHHNRVIPFSSDVEVHVSLQHTNLVGKQETLAPTALPEKNVTPSRHTDSR